MELISVKGDMREIERYLSGLERGVIDRAIIKTLNATAWDLRREANKYIANAVDSPVRMTKNAAMVEQAKSAKQQARVYLRDEAHKGTPPFKYLGPLIHSGGRNVKRFERALQASGILPKGWYTTPGDDAKLNAYGNISSGTITSILSALKASPDPHQNSTKSKQQYVVVKRGEMPIGIYRRSGDDLLSIIHFIRKQPRYKRQIDYFGLLRRELPRKWGKNASYWIKRALDGKL